MKKTTLISSIVIASISIGCGGSDSKDSAFEISSSLSSYSVVEGMKKDIVLDSNRENVTFTFVDNSEAPTTELDRGVLIYRAPLSAGGADQTLIVEAIDANGKESDPLTLSFHTVSSTITPTISVLKTGADDGGIGKDRNFDSDTDGNIIDPYGNIWENTLEGKALASNIYLTAKNRCEVKRLIDFGSNWRVPTAGELLNLIDYSKVSGSSMLDDAFDNINLTTWVEAEDNRYLVVSQSTGLLQQVNFSDRYPVRCINAPKSDVHHIISTEKINLQATIDFTTGLQWSKMTVDSFRKIIDDVNQSAAEYCTQYDNASGWRLPNINEIRSVIENGHISTNIIGNYTLFVSSTPYNNSDTSAKLAHYVIGLDGDKNIFDAVSFADVLYPITCVKER